MGNVSNITDPFAVAQDVANSNGCGTDDVRMAMGGLGHPLPGGSTFGYGSGIFPTITANGAVTDCQVQANSPTANMGATVNYGNYQIARSFHGIYLGALKAPISVTFAASNASNPRIDYVVIRIRDADVDSPAPARTADVVVFTGTPAPTPAEPSGQLTDGDLLLAAVTIRANTTQVLTGDIADRRVYAVARGGIYPMSTADTRVGGYPGQIRYNIATKIYEGWEPTSAAWVPFGSLTTWVTFSPQLYYLGGGAYDFSKICSMGTGAITSARYNLVGKRLTMNYFFQWGSAPYNMGWGPVYTVLPTGMYASQQTHLHTELFATPNSSRWDGNCLINSGSNIMQPQFPFHYQDNRLSWYQCASSSSRFSGTGIPLIVNDYPQGGTLSVAGTVEIQ